MLALLVWSMEPPTKKPGLLAHDFSCVTIPSSITAWRWLGVSSQDRAATCSPSFFEPLESESDSGLKEENVGERPR